MAEITIRKVESLNHNVRPLETDKPDDDSFKPGRATLVAADKDGQRPEKRPFAAWERFGGMEQGRVDRALPEKHLPNFDRYFDLCGPSGMVDSVESAPKEPGVKESKTLTEES